MDELSRLRGSEGYGVCEDEDSFDAGEAAQFQAMAHKLELHKIADFINLTFCCQQATVIADFSDLNAVGRDHYMNLNGGCVPVAEWESLNGAEIARSLIGSGSGTVTPYGVVYDNGMKLEQRYDGTHFPCYYYEPNLLTLTIHEKDMDFHERTATWLFLPMAEEQIQRMLSRSGITNLEQVQVRVQSSQFPDEIDAAMQFDTESVFELNRLCLACERFTEQELAKLGAACQMAKPGSAAEMRQLAENLDLFDFVPDVYSPEAYGKYMIQKSGRFEYDPNLDDFYNYGDYGAARLREEDGVFTDRGYVSYRGAMVLDELMRPDPAEEYRQELKMEMM